MASGDLVAVWNMLPSDDAEEFIAGQSPQDIARHFPTDVRYRQYHGGEFNHRIGSIAIIPTGPNPAHYDPKLARLRWNVDFLVKIVDETVIQTTARQLRDTAADFDWDDAEAVRDWLAAVKASTEHILDKSGVTGALDVAKNTARRHELSITFLRSLAFSKRAHEEWIDVAQKRREGVKALKDCQQQLSEILKLAYILDSFDLLPDPNHFGSYPHPILEESFPGWFLSLADGTDIVYAANALGRTKTGYDAVQAKNRAFGKWRRSHPPDISAIERNAMILSIKDTAGAKPVSRKELLQSPRFGHCDSCDSFCIGRHNDTKHHCVERGTVHQLTTKEFPNLERILYPHDVLNHPLMSAALGVKVDVLAEVGLVAIRVQHTLETHREALRELLHDDDFTAIFNAPATDAKVYVPEEDVGNDDLAITLAIDSVLATRSTCPAFFQPTNPDCRIAWKTTSSKELMKWFESRTPLINLWVAQTDSPTANRDMYMAACHGPEGCTKPPHFFVSQNVVPKLGGGYFIQPGGRKCGLCGSAACKPRRYEKVSSLLHLPPHFSRHI
ncbi:hypothetical protein B0H19DRAFT_1058136 [Mycena capillaripes]|nr:hypothetical protein B0H19DRAFT_1058136 [Mycena capillaripes]